MFQILRYGIDINKHYHKGVYTCMIGKNRKQTRNMTAEVICTLRKGHEDSIPHFDPCPETGSKYDPITLTYQGTHVTLRPWDPYACVIAAGIRNRLIHFPIRPGSGVLALGCSLQTLSHIADIVGPEGRLIGVINKAEGETPSSEELRTFYKSHPGVSVVVEAINSASLDSYERLLSLPLSSKHAFLMALHPRLGAESPARKLLEAEQPTQIARHIFSFLESGDAPDVRCLVVCHWPPGTCIEDIRSVVLSHMNILQQWRASRKTDDQEATVVADSESGDGDDTTEKDTEEKTASASDTHAESSKRRSKDEQESTPLWVFLRLPTDDIAINRHGECVNKKLLQAVANLKKLPSGPRTGLVAKEQLLLSPYFPNHALLLLKYVAHRDARSSKMTKKKIPSPPGLAVPGDGAPSDERPPSSGSVPVPSFGLKFGLPPPPAAEAPAVAPPAAPASSSASAPAPAAAASSSPSAVSALVPPPVRDAPKSRKANDRSPTWMDTQGQEQALAQDLSVGLLGDLAVNPLPADALAALDYFGPHATGPAPLAVARHGGASLPLGAGGALVPRSKGPVGLDNPRGAAQMAPGRHPMMHSSLQGPVTPGPLEHFGADLGAMGLPSAPCMGDRGQMWGLQHVGPSGHIAPPGLWGEGYGQEPVPAGPAGARGGWSPPGYVHYGGGGGGGKGGGAGGPSPGGLGKGAGSMAALGGWRDVPGANGQGSVGAPPPSDSVPPHIDQLQYMAMSF